MTQTRKTVKVEIDWDDPAINEALKNAEQVGYKRGVEEGHKDLLDWLDYAYMNDPGRPDRGTPEGEAILELARSASRYMRKLQGGK